MGEIHGIIFQLIYMRFYLHFVATVNYENQQNVDYLDKLSTCLQFKIL